MELVQLVYASRPFGFDDAVLNGILLQARQNNPRDDITGALICRADIYLQMLEGPEAAVEAAFVRIKRDDRHLEVKRLFCLPVAERMFPCWAMRDYPARNWMCTKQDIADGIIYRASSDDILDIFRKLNDPK